jgi:type VII secretion integral membrane protein EccD
MSCGAAASNAKSIDGTPCEQEVSSVTAPGGLGLARVTVAAPKRRIDVALPDNALVGELLPHLLRHAGEDLPDAEDEQSDWTLRRVTGAELEVTRNLAAQGVRDGELLQLVPRRVDWPELAYDDVVEVVASGARKVGRSWGNQATRACGLGVTSALLAFGLVGLLLSGPPWQIPGLAALGLALVLTIVGIVLSRAGGDAVAGAVVAGTAQLYALVGGLLVAAPAGTPLNRLGAPHALLAGAALLVSAIIGLTGVAAVQRLFTAGLGVGATAVLGALLCYAGMSAAGAAAVAVTLAIGLLPGYPLIASWLGKLPVPELPDRPEKILEDRPVPPRSGVFAAVARSVELLSGMLLAAAIVGSAGTVVLVASGGTAGSLLALAAAAALLLRGRLFPTPQQRLPLLVAGVVGLALLALQVTVRMPSAGARLLVVLGIVVAVILVLAATLTYTRRTPSPYLGRLADILDVLAIMALVPLAAAVVGIYHAIQGGFASI